MVWDKSYEQFSAIELKMNPAAAILLSFGFAMFPYLLWALDGPNQFYYYQITYLPLFVWCIALLSFWIGSYKFYPYKCAGPVKIKVNKYSVKKVGRLILVLTFAQCLLLIVSTRELGYLPILQFSTGINISEVNNDLNQSSFGLHGLIVIITIVLTNYSCMLVGVMHKLPFGTRVVLTFSAAVIILSSIFLGKRQLLLIVSTIFFVHLYFEYAKSRIIKIHLMILAFLMAAILIFAAGLISNLRNNTSNNESNHFLAGVLEIANYLSFPLINFEAQFGISSFLGDFRQVMPVVNQLIPYKLLGGATLYIDEPPAPEPTIGSGMVGILHWNLGVISIPIIYFLYGKVASKWYRLAIANHEYRSAYGLMLWSIISSHTYIHIFSLIFLWAPVLTIYLVNRNFSLQGGGGSFVRRRKRAELQSNEAVK